MKRIFKYPLVLSDEQTVDMPLGAEILCVQDQKGVLCLWALVIDGKRASPRMIEIFGTGHHIPQGGRQYIGTVQHGGGALVWHVFERTT